MSRGDCDSFCHLNHPALFLYIAHFVAFPTFCFLIAFPTLHRNMVMSPSRKSRYINRGIYLSNRDSVASFNGLGPSHTLSDAKDIEAGLKDIEIGIKDMEAGLPYPSNSPKESQDDLHKLQILRECTNWYPGDQSKAAGRLGIDESAVKRSRFSFTPAMFQLGTAALSTEQTKELARMDTDTPSEPSLKEVDVSNEPPDGGALAWAHAFAGHLVAFNVQ